MIAGFVTLSRRGTQWHITVASAMRIGHNISPLLHYYIYFWLFKLDDNSIFDAEEQGIPDPLNKKLRSPRQKTACIHPRWIQSIQMKKLAQLLTSAFTTQSTQIYGFVVVVVVVVVVDLMFLLIEGTGQQLHCMFRRLKTSTSQRSLVLARGQGAASSSAWIIDNDFH